MIKTWKKFNNSFINDMTRNKLYVLSSTACIAGYSWLFLNYNRSISNSIEPGVCLFKRVTSIPCPSCGSTRSVLSFINGDLIGAFWWNPFGILIMIILILLPGWIFYDVISKKNTFFNFYNKAERFLKQKQLAIPAILLVILNWIWNIYKGL